MVTPQLVLHLPSSLPLCLSSHSVLSLCPAPASAEFPAGFNLLVCHYALGDAEAMKRAFLRLLAVPLPQPDDPDADEEGKLDESGELPARMLFRCHAYCS